MLSIQTGYRYRYCPIIDAIVGERLLGWSAGGRIGKEIFAHLLDVRVGAPGRAAGQPQREVTVYVAIQL